MTIQSNQNSSTALNSQIKKPPSINQKKASDRTRQPSNNPSNSTNKKSIVQSADNKNINQRKIKEQHAQEQAKLSAIEEKIERARKKMEDHKKDRKNKAIETRMKLAGITNSNNEDIKDLQDNDDLVKDLQSLEREQTHIPVLSAARSKKS